MTATLTPTAIRKGERTRALLLEIAIRRFAEGGYQGTSVSEIAREAGRTPATVYAYYQGKTGLFEAAVDTDAADLIDNALAATADVPDVRDRLLAFMNEIIARVEQHPLAARVLAGHEPDQVARLLTLPSLVEVTAAVAEEIDQAQMRGEVRLGVEPTEFAIGLETIVLSYLMGMLQTGGTDETRQNAVMTVMRTALEPCR